MTASHLRRAITDAAAQTSPETTEEQLRAQEIAARWNINLASALYEIRRRRDAIEDWQAAEAGEPAEVEAEVTFIKRPGSTKRVKVFVV
jgi:hypothetical protein